MAVPHHAANRGHHFSPEPEQAILVGDDQPTDFAIHDFVKQALSVPSFR